MNKCVAVKMLWKFEKHSLGSGTISVLLKKDQSIKETNIHFSGSCIERSVCLFFVFTRILLPRDARSAKRGIAIASRPSVRSSVCLSVMLMYRVRIGRVSSKVISRSSLLGAPTSAV